METWYLILLSLTISCILMFFFSKNNPIHNLPPGPPVFPVIGNFLTLPKSPLELESLLRSLRSKFGPIITLHLGSRPTIFVLDHSLAHEALVQNGAHFADRPPPLATHKIASSNQHDINSAFYGPTWRALRRNLTSTILHSSNVKYFSEARKLVFKTLKNKLHCQSNSRHPVGVREHFRYAIFSLLAFMCFGERFDQKQVEEIDKVVQRSFLGIYTFHKLNLWPRLTRIILYKSWKEFLQIYKDQDNMLIPLIIERRKKLKEDGEQGQAEDYALSYVDSLLDLQLPEERRKLRDQEIVSLCNEFLVAGTETTSTSLQWIMANLVMYPHIQEKLFMEITSVLGDRDQEAEVTEDDLKRMPFLKAIVFEGLRRHPPGHFLFPRAVTEDVSLGNYVIPKNGKVNFMLVDMGREPKVWENPLEFKPERFMNNDGDVVFDITGSKEIKMMPFGAGRRICPGYASAMLQLEYFIANLVWSFEWRPSDRDPVDLSEKQLITVVMEKPLQVNIFPRYKI
ncbi:hypothetical protein K2173_017240 [Erythroxylum novogranatense]|uniref:Cytochrome P450 n=1 Tax=Erythroxylum novogranatense TaxID=1862640 RepID=A0AAV8U9N1_9ROSI|nr:hypothetical protein K2173_017240 [Erythroxylum novogranatense]